MSRPPVAKRACLLCRQKKTKCDGEPTGAIVFINGSNRVNSQVTRRCTNCKNLGTECVFVLSNRGGRRKKRSLEEEDTYKKSESSSYQRYQFSGNNKYDARGQVDHSNRYGNPIYFAPPIGHDVNLGSHELNPSVGPVAHQVPLMYTHAIPTMIYSTPAPNIINIHSQSQPLYHPWTPKNPWNGSPNWNTSGSKVPPTPPIIIRSTKTTYQEYKIDDNQNTISPTTPTELLSHVGSTYQNFPHPQLLFRNQIIQPLGYQQSSLHNTDLPVLELKNTSPKFQQPILPIHDRSRLLSESSLSSDLTDKPDIVEKYSRKRTKFVENVLKPGNSLEREIIINPERNVLVTEVTNRLGTIPINQGPRDRFTEISATNQPFHDDQLLHYSLPPWETLTLILDTYYINIQPNHQFLPAKRLLMENITLEFDSAILHSIIANVVLLGDSITQQFKINNDVNYWIDLSCQNWETLNELGALACYSLLFQVPFSRLDRERNREFTKQIWKLISDSSYLQVYNKAKNLGYGNTTRQFYEREFIILLLWNFYANQIVLGSHAISKVFKDKLILPLDGIEYCLLKFVPDVKRVRKLQKVPCLDTHSVLIACQIFKSVQTKLAAKKFEEKDRQLCKKTYRKYRDYMRGRHLTFDGELVIVNSLYLKASLIFKTGENLQLVYLARALIPLRPLTQIQNHNMPLEPLIRDASNELSSLGGFSTILDKQPVSN